MKFKFRISYKNFFILIYFYPCNMIIYTVPLQYLAIRLGKLRGSKMVKVKVSLVQGWEVCTQQGAQCAIVKVSAGKNGFIPIVIWLGDYSGTYHINVVSANGSHVVCDAELGLVGEQLCKKLGLVGEQLCGININLDPVLYIQELFKKGLFVAYTGDQQLTIMVKPVGITGAYTISNFV